MAINISERDWDIMMKAGATREYMTDWVTQKRDEGWSDDMIQNKIDEKISSLSSDPEFNSERGANLGGVVRAGLQGIPAIGSYADEAEAGVRAAGDALIQEMMYQQEHRNDPKPTPQIPGIAGQLIQNFQNFQDTQKRYDEAYNKSYDKYLKNARESFEGALENIPEYAYPAYIGTGVLGEGLLALGTGGASLTPAAQAAMGAAYGYGMGEGTTNRAADAALVGILSAAIPAGGRYLAKGGNKLITKFGEKQLAKKYPVLNRILSEVGKNKNEAENSMMNKIKLASKEPQNIDKEIKIINEDNGNLVSILAGGTKNNAENVALKNEVAKYGTTAELKNGAEEIINKTWKGQVIEALNNMKFGNLLSDADKKAIDTMLNVISKFDDEATINSAIKTFKQTLSKDAIELLEKNIGKEALSKELSEEILTNAAKTTSDNTLFTMLGSGVGALSGTLLGGGPASTITGLVLGALGAKGLQGGVVKPVVDAAKRKAESMAAKALTKEATQTLKQQAEKGFTKRALTKDQFKIIQDYYKSEGKTITPSFSDKMKMRKATFIENLPAPLWYKNMLKKGEPAWGSFGSPLIRILSGEVPMEWSKAE